MTRYLQHVSLLAGIVLILAGCASRSPAPASFPEKFSVSSGGFSGDSFAITREGNQLVYRRFSSKPFQSRTVRLSPNEHQWRVFWAEADAVSLWKWKPSYKPAFLVNDGTHWSIEIEHNGRKVTSHGDNAYPGDLTPAISAERSKRYTRFLSAIRALIGKRHYY